MTTARDAAMAGSTNVRPGVPDDAVDAWIRRHQLPTWRYLRLCGCKADGADDLVQEAMIAALHKRVHECDDRQAAAWLRGAAANLWRMRLRGEARRAARMSQLAADRAYTQCAADDGGEAWLGALRRCLQELDGRARQLLDQNYGRGSSREAIAAAMGLQPEGVKTYLRRVRELLRQCVLRRLADEEART
jgi:RNA polymerase sigma-70 factor (ECF subfamily)